jgi:outer membrane protein insertion porin family
MMILIPPSEFQILPSSTLSAPPFNRAHGLFVFSVLLLLLVSSAVAEGPRLRRIEIEGNERFSSSEIFNWLGLKAEAPYSEALLHSGIQQLLRHYRVEGFYSAAVDSVKTFMSNDSSSVDLLLYIHEGRRTELGELNITGTEQISKEEILSMFESKPGSPLQQSRLELDIEALLAKYDENGFPFAKVGVDSISGYEEDGESKLRVTLHVDEGPRTTIDEVKIEGNKSTKDYVILREMRLNPGEMYSRQKIGAIRQRLERLNLFSSVSEPELYFGAKGTGLLVRVQEGNTNNFDGILGYVPKGTATQAGYFTGFANISLRNLFGTGRKFAVRWQRENRETQEIELHYLEPWVVRSPVNVGVGFLQREQDSTYIRRKIDLKADVSVADNLSFAVLAGQDRIIPSSGLLAPIVSESRTTSAGVEVRYDSRTDAVSPTGGILYRSDYQLGRKTFLNAADSGRPRESVTVKRFGVDVEFYLQAFPRQVVATGLHARDLRGDRIEDGDLYRFGGATTLRGYRENQFLGSSIVWSNAEYRFLMGRRSFLYGFVDMGYYFRPEDARRGIVSSEALKVGFGIGFRVETSLGLIGVSYALARGDTFSTGKLHFALFNQF